MLRNFLSLTLLVAFTFSPAPSIAAPILNRGAPAGADILIYPDHTDPNLYYINPTSLSMALDERSVPLFSYVEFFTDKKGGWGSTVSGLMQVLMKPSVNEREVEAAKVALREINPAAVFSALPFNESRIQITPSLERLILPGSCSHRGGVVGQIQECSVNLTPMGVRVFRPKLKGGIVIALQFEYTISGVLQRADGGFESASLPMGVGGYIGGPSLKAHPELFRFMR